MKHGNKIYITDSGMGLQFRGLGAVFCSTNRLIKKTIDNQGDDIFAEGTLRDELNMVINCRYNFVYREENDINSKLLW
jgi:hypothetical protein